MRVCLCECVRVINHHNYDDDDDDSQIVRTVKCNYRELLFILSFLRDAPFLAEVWNGCDDDLMILMLMVGWL